MASLHALQLLTNAAHLAQKQKESFSRQEILQKINEIKYLTGQKKVPKLTLRKEVIHLENQLKGVIELEKKLLREKNVESIKISSLKQQIASLKNKLKAVEDQELDKKVDKLSYLLGEYLAKKEASKEVAVTRLRTAPTAEEKKEDAVQKAQMLQKRLDALKQELKIHQELGTKNPHELEMVEGKITLLEQKLQEFYEKHPQLRKEIMPPWVKHEVLFPQPAREKEVPVEKELPLPPPPRMERRE